MELPRAPKSPRRGFPSDQTRQRSSVSSSRVQSLILTLSWRFTDYNPSLSGPLVQIRHAVFAGDTAHQTYLDSCVSGVGNRLRYAVLEALRIGLSVPARSNCCAAGRRSPRRIWHGRCETVVMSEVSPSPLDHNHENIATDAVLAGPER